MANWYGKADQTFTGTSATQQLRNVANNTKLCQSWTPGATSKFTAMRFMSGGKTSSPTGNVWCAIYTTSPEGSALVAQSSNIDVSTWPAASTVVNFIFPTLVTLTSGTQYFCVIDGDFVVGANYINFQKVSAGGYSGGSMWTYNGSTWTDTSSQDLIFTSFNCADGGNFDIDTTTANVAALTALKGGTAPASTDNIFVYNGATLTVDTGDNLACTLITLGDMSTGKAPNGQQYGIVQCNAGSTITFTGNATNTLSGIKSSPTTAGAESVNCRLIFNGTSASHVTLTNSVGSLNASNRYTINGPYGYGTVTFADFRYSYNAWFTNLSPSSTYSGGTWTITDCTGTALGAAGAIASFGAVTWDRACDFRRNTANAGGNNGTIFFNTQNATPAAGGSIQIDGSIMNGGGAAATFNPFSMKCVNQDTYVNGRISFADIRPTTVVPTGLALTDPATNGELRATITNIASYAATDVLVFYNNTGGAELGRCTVAKYNADTYATISGLTNATAYTMYAKATSDENTYSAASGTASGTPTLGADTTARVSEVIATDTTISWVGKNLGASAGTVTLDGAAYTVDTWTDTGGTGHK